MAENLISELDFGRFFGNFGRGNGREGNDWRFHNRFGYYRLWHNYSKPRRGGYHSWWRLYNRSCAVFG